VQKLRAQEMKEQVQEAVRNKWFNQDRPMPVLMKTWKENWIENEERSSDSEEDGLGEEHGDQGNVEINMVFDLPT
jgi:hypothetical protein